MIVEAQPIKQANSPLHGDSCYARRRRSCVVTHAVPLDPVSDPILRDATARTSRAGPLPTTRPGTSRTRCSASTAYWLQVGVNRHVGRPQRRDHVAVQLDDEDRLRARRGRDRRRHRRAPDRILIRCSAVRSSCSSRAEIASRLLGSARITTLSAGVQFVHDRPRHMPQPPRHPVPMHGVANGFGDDQADLGSASAASSTRNAWTTRSGWTARVPLTDREHRTQSTASSGTAPEAPR